LTVTRYIRAFEVGRNPTSSKYEVHVRLRTLKNGPVVRNRLRLPHPVKTDIRICVIAAPDSKAAEEARAAGAVLVGEDDVFAQIKEGIIEFDRCICHADSLQKMNKAGLGRQLGPKGLMPSTKTGTVVTQVGASVRNMVGGSEYRERLGVIRMAVGQLGFTPEELQRNVKAFMDMVKKDISAMSDRINKEIHEVVSELLDISVGSLANNRQVLSSTNAPGFTLSGDYRGPNSIAPKELSGPL
jgi:large subunit ribosomal protein L1